MTYSAIPPSQMQNNHLPELIFYPSFAHVEHSARKIQTGGCNSWEGTVGSESPASRTLISRIFLSCIPRHLQAGSIYYNRACGVFLLFSITQTKDKSRRVHQRRIFARTFVSFVYFDAICNSNNMIMLKLLFIIFFSTFYQRGLPLSTPRA